METPQTQETEAVYYDSQGFRIVEDENSLTRTPDFKRYSDYLSNKFSDENKQTLYLLTNALESLFFEHAQSIVNLDAQVKYYILGLMKAYELAKENNQDSAKFKQQLLIKYHNLVETHFVHTLEKHYTASAGFDLHAINRDLDKLAKQFQKKIAKDLESQGLNKLPQSQLAHSLETTAIYHKGFKIKQENYTIECSNGTAHNENGPSAATAYQYAKSDNPKTWIRTPLIVPKKGKQRIEKAQENIQTCIDKLPTQTTAEALPIFYHLLTSYHQGLGRLLLDGGNQQSTRAVDLMKIQDQWNNDTSKTQKFYPIYLPVNGYGQEIRSDSGDKNIQAMAWRNNLAFIQMLGNDEQKTAATLAYKGYLQNPTTSPAESLQKIINQLNTKRTGGDPDTKLKNLLSYIVKNKLHETHMHEFAKMIQAISLYLNANQAMVGCKSGNERTAMILHRLNAILDGDVEIPDSPINLQVIKKFNQALDKAVNDKHVAGFANFISLHDQHAVPKIGPRKFFPNTNNAESASMSNLFTGSASGMQAHKNKLGLNALSSPSRASVIRARTLALASIGLIGLAGITVFFPFVLPITLSLSAKIILGMGLIGIAAFGLKKFTALALQSGYSATHLNLAREATITRKASELEMLEILGHNPSASAAADAKPRSNLIRKGKEAAAAQEKQISDEVEDLNRPQRQ